MKALGLRTAEARSMKTKYLPCPYPGMYDAGRCCGGDCRTDADIIRATRNILTEWNFGSMTDRDALIRIHAFAGDNIQNAASASPQQRTGQ